MSLLKNIPLRYSGRLHDIHLVNFTIDPAEIAGQLPAPLKPRLFDGRAMISMVDVHLRDMTLKKPWWPFRVNYQHIGFRLLLEDADYHEGDDQKGIYFLRSFTDKPLIAQGGRLLTEYKLETATLTNHAGGLRLAKGPYYLDYNHFGRNMQPDEETHALENVIGKLDRAYAVRGNGVYRTRILREGWPLVPLNTHRFRTNFFESAQLEGIFRVDGVIDYVWEPAEKVATLVAQERTVGVGNLKPAHG